MKRILTTTIIIFAAAAISMGQSWQKFNYQGVARNAIGEVIDNQAIGVRISIHSGTMAGPTEYQETHAVTTNDFGLFDLAVGGGTAVSGTFGTIAWGADNFYVQIEMDAAGGTSYTNMGTSQLLSSPYALYSKESGDAPSSISGNANYLVKFTGSEAGGNSSIYENGSGHIGIGTTAPMSSFHVNASGSELGRFQGSAASKWIGIYTGNSREGMLWSSGNDIRLQNDNPTGVLQFDTDGYNPRMTIDENGYVGINTTSPAQVLHVKQVMANRGSRIEHQSAADYWENGVGTTTKNYKFYYNNLFRADISSVDGAYTQSSDRRLKRDLNYLEGVLPAVLQLKAASYHYIDGRDGDPLSIGFVAQEVESIFPDLVREGDDGYKGITYDGFAVIAIKAIQEQQEMIEQLKAEVEVLKSK